MRRDERLNDYLVFRAEGSERVRKCLKWRVAHMFRTAGLSASMIAAHMKADPSEVWRFRQVIDLVREEEK